MVVSSVRSANQILKTYLRERCNVKDIDMQTHSARENLYQVTLYLIVFEILHFISKYKRGRTQHIMQHE